MEPTESIQVLMEDLDENNIVSILNKWKELTGIRKQLEEWENALREKVKVHLKERQWKEYFCPDNKINVTLNTERRETINPKQLKLILSPGQLAQVTRVTTFERLTITTAEMRETMKNYLKRGTRGK